MVTNYSLTEKTSTFQLVMKIVRFKTKRNKISASRIIILTQYDLFGFFLGREGDKKDNLRVALIRNNVPAIFTARNNPK